MYKIWEVAVAECFIAARDSSFFIEIEQEEASRYELPILVHFINLVAEAIVFFRDNLFNSCLY